MVLHQHMTKYMYPHKFILQIQTFVANVQVYPIFHLQKYYLRIQLNCLCFDMFKLFATKTSHNKYWFLHFDYYKNPSRTYQQWNKKSGDVLHATGTYERWKQVKALAEIIETKKKECAETHRDIQGAVVSP